MFLTLFHMCLCTRYKWTHQRPEKGEGVSWRIRCSGEIHNPGTRAAVRQRVTGHPFESLGPVNTHQRGLDAADGSRLVIGCR